MPDAPVEVLSIAGSDPGGGAGLQLDLKVFTALGADGCAVPACLTVQDEQGLSAVEVVDAELVASQLRAVFGCRAPRAVKLGALGDRAVVEVVAELLAERPALPVIWDPVHAASRAHAGAPPLLDEAGWSLAVERLSARGAHLTPNLGEAERLTGGAVGTPEQRLRAVEELLGMGFASVLLKGGHDRGEGGRVVDVFASGDAGPEEWAAPRVPGGEAVHGTGCALSAAWATGLARGLPVREAAEWAVARVRGWIAASRGGRLLPIHRG